MPYTSRACPHMCVHTYVLAPTGHSKGGDVVLLNSAEYDNVPLIVNVAGRFDMTRGFRERFGEEAIAKVLRLGQVRPRCCGYG